MLIDTRKLWFEGKSLWMEYVRLNGYSFSPTESGIKNLSRSLDLNTPYIRKCISIYLDN